MTTTHGFIVNDDLGYTYNTSLAQVENVESLLDDLSDLLNDMPDPVWLWLDERGPDMVNGPGAFTCEIQNDQTTLVAFILGDASSETVLEFLNGCAETIRDHYYIPADDDATFRLGFNAHYVTARNSLDDLLRVTFRIFWEVSN
jgi:hypothetical protein